MSNRRTAWLCLPLIAALATSALADDTDAPPKAPTSSSKTYEWVFHYYMAYDNNLEKCAKPILNMLRKGLTNDKVCVLVSADLRDTDGMTRTVITSGGRTVTRLSEEGSADEAVLKTELEWVKTFRAKRYALVFLNHGGGLGQMSYDENPGANKRAWLYPPRVNEVVSRWKASLSGSVELLFLQQCGKGSLENYYAFRNSAKFVMGSQTVVGAPNTYYVATLRRVCAKPDLDGAALAELITATESPRMFTTYTTFSSAALKELPERINAALEPLLKVEGDAFKAFKLGTLQTCFKFPSQRQLFFDGQALLESLYAANDLDRAPLEAFVTWTKERLITSHRVSPLKTKRAGTWSGYSLFVPFSANGLGKHKEHYSIYSDTKLPALYERVRKDVRRQLLARRKAQRRRAKKAAGAGAK
ncbi:MAG: hypothetical protein JKY65_15170 [Planctomycetes bacterium]|nr:hypothetical protein [Planctomycetota bacterium]